jgi:hypothetical protein
VKKARIECGPSCCQICRLFLVGGLIILTTAALLGCLAGLAWHLIRLAGFIALLWLIWLILLGHGTAPVYQQALHRARATVLILHSTKQKVAGLPIDFIGQNVTLFSTR